MHREKVRLKRAFVAYYSGPSNSLFSVSYQCQALNFCTCYDRTSIPSGMLSKRVLNSLNPIYHTSEYQESGSEYLENESGNEDCGNRCLVSFLPYSLSEQK